MSPYVVDVSVVVVVVVVVVVFVFVVVFVVAVGMPLWEKISKCTIQLERQKMRLNAHVTKEVFNL